MSYWKCTEAKVSEDGLSVSMSFKDSHSASTLHTTLPAEDWKNIWIYRAAYEEPNRAMMEASRDVSAHIWRCVEAERAREEARSK